MTAIIRMGGDLEMWDPVAVRTGIGPPEKVTRGGIWIILYTQGKV